MASCTKSYILQPFASKRNVRNVTFGWRVYLVITNQISKILLWNLHHGNIKSDWLKRYVTNAKSKNVCSLRFDANGYIYNDHDLYLYNRTVFFLSVDTITAPKTALFLPYYYARSKRTEEILDEMEKERCCSVNMNYKIIFCKCDRVWSFFVCSGRFFFSFFFSLI